MRDILMLGYYGFKNSGDDALLLSIIQQLKNQDKALSLSVLSFNPKETCEQFGIRAVDRNNVFKVIKEIISSKMLLVGGGTLIQDSTSTKSLIYYLAVIAIALFFGKKVMIYANGIGPLKEKNQKITRAILNRVKIITLREEMSRSELSKIGVDKPQIYVTADSVFGISYDKDIEINKENYQIVSVRNNKALCDDFCEIIAKICDEMYEKNGISTVFVPFQKKNDTEIAEKIRGLMNSSSEIFDADCEFSKLMSLMKNAKLCIGMRLHSLIYSVISSVPCVGLVYDQKVKAFMDYIGQSRYLDAKDLSYDELFKMTDEAFCNADKIKAEMSEKAIKLKELSEENAKIAIGLLKD